MPVAKKRSKSSGPQRTPGPGIREQSAQATRESILRGATKVFARLGFSGATTQLISKAARSHDRMIYYYFGSKERLFTAVLEEQYRQFNEAEAALELRYDDPRHALEQVIRFVWGYYQEHPEFISLLNDENLHKAAHIADSPNARDCSLPAVGVLRSILDAGVNHGIFRQGLIAHDIYMMIAALGYFYLSNRHTLSATLGHDLAAEDAKSHWLGFVLDAVFRTVSKSRADT